MSPSHPHNLFCFGYGYCSDFLAMALREQGGWDVGGTTQDREKRTRMRAGGMKAHLLSYDHPLSDPRRILDGTTHVLISTPPDDTGDPAFLQHAEDLLRIPTIEWVGYLSSTSVYGDRDGGWVDEDMAPHPNSKRGTRRLRAEQQWLSLFEEEGMPVHIFRLAGIYGPGRSALDSVRAGVSRRIEKQGHAFSRVHIDDIVRVLQASIARPNPGRIYNVCDDEAAPSHEVIAYACELLGLTPPPLIPYEQADLAPMTRSFYADNKRVRNNRIKDELGVALKYPEFRAGLRACLAAEKDGLSFLSGAPAVSQGG